VAKPFANELAGVCDRPWSGSYSRVGAVLGLASRSRGSADPLGSGNGAGSKNQPKRTSDGVQPTIIPRRNAWSVVIERSLAAA
jgi:hypothetical protein